jgi:hypothetical protein
MSRLQGSQNQKKGLDNDLLFLRRLEQEGHIVYTCDELTELLDFFTCSDTFKSK